MINIFRKMKQKSKDRIFSEYPCADFLHNALHFLARNKPEVTYGEICYALLKTELTVSHYRNCFLRE